MQIMHETDIICQNYTSIIALQWYIQSWCMLRKCSVHPETLSFNLLWVLFPCTDRSCRFCFIYHKNDVSYILATLFAVLTISCMLTNNKDQTGWRIYHIMVVWDLWFTITTILLGLPFQGQVVTDHNLYSRLPCNILLHIHHGDFPQTGPGSWLQLCV